MSCSIDYSQSQTSIHVACVDKVPAAPNVLLLPYIVMKLSHLPLLHRRVALADTDSSFSIHVVAVFSNSLERVSLYLYYFMSCYVDYGQSQTSILVRDKVLVAPNVLLLPYIVVMKLYHMPLLYRRVAPIDTSFTLVIHVVAVVSNCQSNVHIEEAAQITGDCVCCEDDRL